MTETLITPSIIAKEALMQLENNLVLGNQVHRSYKNEFAKVGDTINIRRPVKFETTDGAVASVQDVEEKNFPITVQSRKHVAWGFSTQDLTMTIEKYSERYIKPAMITLANTMDRSGYNLYRTVWNSVGSPGTTPSTYAHVAPIAERMDDMAVPAEQRTLIMNPKARYAITGDQLGLDGFGSKVKSAYENAKVGRIANLDTLATQNLPTHTVGVATGTPKVNGADQNVTYLNAGNANTQTLITDGWTNSTTGILKAGDVFTIDGVYAVNPVPGDDSEGKKAMPYLQQFTVMADANSGASTGPATLTISPAIIVNGPQQTVSAAPANDADINVLGTGGTAYPQNIAFHKNAFSLITVPLEMPDGAAFKARESHNGLSVRVIKSYDFTNDRDLIRLDVLYGWNTIYPDLAVRLWG